MATDRLSDQELADAKARRMSFQGLLNIERNSLTADEVAMFEMFEREHWPHQRCRQYILDHLGDRGQIAAE